jgi:peptide-methionine (S)-S-oxide reductase
MGALTACAAEPAVVIARLRSTNRQAPNTRPPPSAGGCFWGVQGVFQHVKGVTSAVSGYTGGEARTANYESVEQGDTGHAESVKITYDPRRSATASCCKCSSRWRTTRPS